ncbi:secretin N-terminal domain-containing protein [Malonomonas rubra]|uniref:secretin N-terminal domain-containing protein n=1 Tax=Malonomonas rubra TaxID=57040 RepID=UPI0026E99947|nr:secretin N-terminal domain-containing protein [Malonomonas rubra]
MTEGNYDRAVTSLLSAVEKDPKSSKYRLKLNLARDKASQTHKHLGDSFFQQEQYLSAKQEYQLAVDMDGANFSAADALSQTVKHLQAEKMTQEAAALLKERRRLQAKNTVEQALGLVADFQPALRLKQQIEKTALTIIDGVELEVTSDQPITLNFTNAKLPDVFEILTSLSGINFILDEDVRGTNTTLFLENATFAQALELLLRMNKLDKKILNSKTIILFPQTRDKQKQFEDQLIHTFYLSNIDAKKAVNLLRTMLQIRKIYVHEELNAIIVRDTPPVIRLAAKIIEANDRSNSEVVFDLELIEVNHTDTRNLGLKLSDYQLSGGVSLGGETLVKSALEAGATVAGLVPGGTAADEFSSFYTLPTATFRLVKTQVDAEVLASPKIRVKNKEKAKVHIGSREPVITVTTSGTDNVSENVQYVDVGVKLDVEPTIQLDNTIVTKVGLEVSNVSGRQTTDNGTAVITISTTNANTSLTLKDGEQTIIGGLIRDDKSTTKNKIPILGDLPFIGELFNGTDKSDIKREILLSITPHIVKSVTLPEHDVASIWSGGEDDLKDGRNFGSFAREYEAGQKGLEPEVDYRPTDLESAEVMPAAEEPGGTTTPPVVEEKAPPQPALGQGPAETQPAMVPSPTALPAPETAAPETAAPETAAPETAAPETAAPGFVTDSEVPTPTAEPGVAVTEVQMPTAEPPAEVVPRVYVQGSQLVKVGETFSLGFQVDEIKELFSAPLYVQYDENLFEFVSATEGPFLKQGISPTIFTHTVLEGSGRVIVGLKQGAGGKGVSGSGELFIMNFKGKTVGKGTIETTRTNFRNPRGVRLKVESTGLQIEVQ